MRPHSLCPHCGAQRAHNVMRSHIAACPVNPAVRRATVALLADPDRPGYAVTYTAYVSAQPGTGAATGKMLRDHYGSWRAAAEAHGFLVDIEPPMETCPHCRRQVLAAYMYLHAPRCVERPEVYAATHELMIDPDNPACARSYSEYRRLAEDDGIASLAGALYEHYGTWEEVIAVHGLQPRKRRRLVHDRSLVLSLNAPLTEAERHACARRGLMER